MSLLIPEKCFKYFVHNIHVNKGGVNIRNISQYHTIHQPHTHLKIQQGQDISDQHLSEIVSTTKKRGHT